MEPNIIAAIVVTCVIVVFSVVVLTWNCLSKCCH